MSSKLPVPTKIPTGTYRLQFHAGWNLRQATDLVPYLHALGISHIYASPFLKARPLSPHGYDICDPGEINPEIGDESDLQALVAALRVHEMGLVLDIVPNHLAAVTANPRWRDVLQFGRRSRFAEWFDVQWESPDPESNGKIILPILSTDLALAVKSGEVSLVNHLGEAVVRVSCEHYPIDPESYPPSLSALEKTVGVMNSDPALLLRLLERQNYRLIPWRDGDACINYRRFFTINDLAGVRVELPEVFAGMHFKVLDWIQRGLVDGLRVDHPDGLADPLEYLQKLREAAPEAWIVVEKILERDEVLPAGWPVAGTTGYDFLARVSALWIEGDAREAFSEFYESFTGESSDYPALAREKKRWILTYSLSAEIERLANLFGAIEAAFTPDSVADRRTLRETLIEVLACFPVYRTYFRAGQPDSSMGQDWIAQALARAQQPPATASARLLTLLGQIFQGARGTKQSPDLVSEFIVRFQQVSGAAMAKGVEDTAFYGFNRFLALNEVGCSPDRFGAAVEDFHRASADSSARWPHAMLATSTHDTKRSEDVRSRLAVLSEIPTEWFAAVQRWSAMTERHRHGDKPDRNAVYHYLQTLAGAWPLEVERGIEYMRKAAREAKRYTSWTEVSPKYESVLIDFVRATLADAEFVADVSDFVRSIAPAGSLNALAETVLKLTAPGVPDVYQGTELSDFSLVDPDNRRPVDFARRRSVLTQIQESLACESRAAYAQKLLHASGGGELKLYLIQQTLCFRRSQARLFAAGSYQPLTLEGEHARHACAFARIHIDGALLVLVPRLTYRRCAERGTPWPLGPEFWQDTRLALPGTLKDRHFRNLYTDEVVVGHKEGGKAALPLGDAFKTLPVAVLEVLSGD